MDNEEIQGVKFSEFPSQTPSNSDEVVGLHSGDNARFTIANIIAAVRQGLASIFVPLTRTINGKTLNSDISLDSSDISYDNTGSGLTATDVQEAIDELAQGGGGGGGSAADITYDPTASGLTATNVQDAVDEMVDDLDDKQDTITTSGILKGDGQGGVTAATAGTDYQTPLTAGTDYATPAQLDGKANQSQLAYVETGTTASRNYTAGQYISLNGLLYTADTAIASGATFYTSGGNKNLTECVGGGFNSLFTKTPKYTHFEIVSASSVDHLIQVESSVIIITNSATHTANGSSLYYGIVSATNATYSNLIAVQKDSNRPTTVTAGAGKITITTTVGYVHVVVIEYPT